MQSLCLSKLVIYDVIVQASIINQVRNMVPFPQNGFITLPYLKDQS